MLSIMNEDKLVQIFVTKETRDKLREKKKETGISMHRLVKNAVEALK